MSAPDNSKTFRQIAITQFKRNKPAVVAAYAVVGLMTNPSRAPTDAAHGSSWIEPDHYMVDAVFSGAWFYSGWFELEIANGKIASWRALDGHADTFAANMDVDEFFSTPRQALDRSKREQLSDGLNLEFTVAYDASGNPTEICWDDPMALDEEGCWNFRNYRGASQPSSAWVEPSSYTFTFGHSYFGPGAGVYLVTVRDGRVIAFEATDERGAQAIEDEWVTIGQMRTIGEVVRMYEQALRNDESDATITYDESTGAPRSVTIDWIREAADDEDYFEISNIVVN